MNKILKALRTRMIMIFGRFGIGGGKIRNVGVLHTIMSLSVFGRNNIVDVKSRLSNDVKILMYGNNHQLKIEEGVIFKQGKLWFEDNNCVIHISKGTTIEEAKIYAAESNSKIVIGEDCMISAEVRLSTSDGHSIIDATNDKRINLAADIIIEPHVWIGYRVTINKGVYIGRNSIIAANSVVTHDVPENCIVAGVPARVIKENVKWLRERI